MGTISWYRNVSKCITICRSTSFGRNGLTYLITGATGEIGSRVVRQLLQRGERPRVFVRDKVKARLRFGDRVDIRLGDLADPESLASAFDTVDAIFLVNSGPRLAVLDELAALTAQAADVGQLVKPFVPGCGGTSGARSVA